MTRLFTFVLGWLFCLPLLAEDVPATPPTPAEHPPAKQAPAQSWLDITQTPYGPVMMQQATPPPYRDYQMNRILTPEERKRWLQMAMPMMGSMVEVDAREAMNYFAVKYPVKPGVSFDDVVGSMKLRANQLNLQFVGNNQIWKQFRTVLRDETAPRVEILSFCDIAVGRDLLRVIPEMAVFLPCRIVVMEDADKRIWVMTLDWDATRLDLAGKQRDIKPELRKGVMAIRDKLDKVMRAGANGEL